MKGFTLIELLVVVVIISILSGTGVATFLGYQDKARIAAQKASLRSSINELLALRIDYENGDITANDLMQKDLSVVEEAIILGRQQTEQNLIDITGNSCSECVCRGRSLLAPYSAQAQTCVDNWDTILTALKGASDMDLSFMDADPWGSPYLVDENEGEFSGTYCRRDRVNSAGPDRVHDDAANDDVAINMTYYDVAQCGP